MKKDAITVVIPTYPARAEMLGKALASVMAQTLLPDAVMVVVDKDEEGAAITRTRGLHLVKTPWVALLDDDDMFKPCHLEHLMAYQHETKADMVFPWFDVIGGTDPFPTNRDKEFDLSDPHQTTVTVLCRTAAAKKVNGWLWDEEVDKAEDPGWDSEGHRSGEEFRFAIRLAQHGYKIAHTREATWTWVHHQSNTQGLPSRR